MRFDLEGLTVYFPYEFIYPEQYRYMLELKHALDARGHCLLEVRGRPLRSAAAARCRCRQRRCCHADCQLHPPLPG